MDYAAESMKLHYERKGKIEMVSRVKVHVNCQNGIV